jgi:hypothetical protein
MNTAATQHRTHPQPQRLALYAGGDLPFWAGLRVARHVELCPGCAKFVSALRQAGKDLRQQATNRTLTGFEAIADWPGLEAEMSGNISVGLAAARCIRSKAKGRRWLLGSLATAGFAGLLAFSWSLHIPAEESRALAAKLYRWVGSDAPLAGSGAVMRASPDGIAVRTQGLTLTMRHPRSAVVSVAGNSAIEARYVDEETGQVTISSVYAQ